MAKCSKMDMVDTIMNADTDDLRLYSDMVREGFNRAQSKAKFQFSVGDRVCWSGRRGNRCGRVSKIMRKNIKVNADDGMIWTVSPSLLEKE